MKLDDKQNYIYWLKFIAVILVLNSHLDKLYPISALATGGSLGNSLFFFVSGYTWNGGVKKKSFFTWWIEKAKRIFLPTIITNTIYMFLYSSFSIGLFGILAVYLYPNKSWFCGAILLFAFVYYWIAKCDEKWIYISLVILTVSYLVWYLTKLDLSIYSVESMNRGGLCRLSYYGICMIAGLLYKRKESCFKGIINRKTSTFFLGFFSLGLLYADKFLMSRYALAMRMQFINQVLTLTCVLFFVRGLYLSEDVLRSYKYKGFVRIIAEYSWEIYLVQTLLIPQCIRFRFPINVAITLVGTGLGAFVLKILLSTLQNSYTKHPANFHDQA